MLAMRTKSAIQVTTNQMEQRRIPHTGTVPKELSATSNNGRLVEFDAMAGPAKKSTTISIAPRPRILAYAGAAAGYPQMGTLQPERKIQE